MSIRQAFVLATVSEVDDLAVTYPACHKCYSKLLVDLLTYRYYCVKCGTSYEKRVVQWRYRLVLSITDGATVGRVVVFGWSLNSLFGKSATDFHRGLCGLEEKGYPCESMLRDALIQTFEGNYFYFGFKMPDSRCPLSAPCLADVFVHENSSAISLNNSFSTMSDSYCVLAHQMLPVHDQTFLSVTDRIRAFVRALTLENKETNSAMSILSCLGSTFSSVSTCNFDPKISCGTSTQDSVMVKCEDSGCPKDVLISDVVSRTVTDENPKGDNGRKEMANIKCKDTESGYMSLTGTQQRLKSCDTEAGESEDWINHSAELFEVYADETTCSKTTDCHEVETISSPVSILPDSIIDSDSTGACHITEEQSCNHEKGSLNVSCSIGKSECTQVQGSLIKENADVLPDDNDGLAHIEGPLDVVQHEDSNMFLESLIWDSYFSIECVHDDRDSVPHCRCEQVNRKQCNDSDITSWKGANYISKNNVIEKEPTGMRRVCNGCRKITNCGRISVQMEKVSQGRKSLEWEQNSMYCDLCNERLNNGNQTLKCNIETDKPATADKIVRINSQCSTALFTESDNSLGNSMKPCKHGSLDTMPEHSTEDGGLHLEHSSVFDASKDLFDSPEEHERSLDMTSSVSQVISESSTDYQNSSFDLFTSTQTLLNDCIVESSEIEDSEEGTTDSQTVIEDIVPEVMRECEVKVSECMTLDLSTRRGSTYPYVYSWTKNKLLTNATEAKDRFGDVCESSADVSICSSSMTDIFFQSPSFTENASQQHVQCLMEHVNERQNHLPNKSSLKDDRSCNIADKSSISMYKSKTPDALSGNVIMQQLEHVNASFAMSPDCIWTPE